LRFLEDFFALGKGVRFGFGGVGHVKGGRRRARVGQQRRKGLARRGKRQGNSGGGKLHSGVVVGGGMKCKEVKGSTGQERRPKKEEAKEWMEAMGNEPSGSQIFDGFTRQRSKFNNRVT